MDDLVPQYHLAYYSRIGTPSLWHSGLFINQARPGSLQHWRRDNGQSIHWLHQSHAYARQCRAAPHAQQVSFARAGMSVGCDKRS